MGTSLRKSDSAAETEVCKFLDKYFYSAYVSNFIRFYDLESQLSGKDVKFDYQGIADMIVDEKAAIHYVNQGLPTFAFEISFYANNGELTKGWFFDKSKLTQYYLLSWIWAQRERGFSCEEISRVELVIVKRDSILDMIRFYGLNDSRVQSIASAIRESGMPGVHHKDQRTPFYYYYSTKLAEKPVNLIIRKQKLLELAVGNHIVSR